MYIFLNFESYLNYIKLRCVNFGQNPLKTALYILWKLTREKSKY